MTTRAHRRMEGMTMTQTITAALVSSV